MYRYKICCNKLVLSSRLMSLKVENNYEKKISTIRKFARRLSSTVLNLDSKTKDKSVEKFGQPTTMTHPHIVQSGEANPGLKLSEFHRRRDKLIKLLEEKANQTSAKHQILIFPSATKSYMSKEIMYRFHQDSNLRYFSGFLEPDSVFILHSTSNERNNSFQSVLFVDERSKNSELWEGPASGVQGAKFITDVDKVLKNNELQQYLNWYASNTDMFVLWYDHMTPINIYLHAHVFRSFMQSNKVISIENPGPLADKVRSIKSPAEQLLMEETCNVASAGIVSAMRNTAPGVSEAVLWSCMEHECRMRGADYLAYIPVVAGGERANTIHYTRNDQLLRSGELVLMDAGCCHKGYVSDISRTWPVSGRFSRAQRSLYLLLLDIQLQCIELATQHHSLDHIYNHMIEQLGRELQKIGVISQQTTAEARNQMARRLCPHHVGHLLGLDVHDTPSISRRQPLLPGHVLTIEPGLYIPRHMSDVPEEYRGTGLRIEDDLLVTEHGARVLTHSCPKTIDEIEAVLTAK